MTTYMPADALRTRGWGSALEHRLAADIEAAKLPAPTREYKFHPGRKWRFDFAWPDSKIAVEVEGGTFTNGRHTRPTGFQQDAEKYNAAAESGWTVLRFTKVDIEGGRVKKGKRMGCGLAYCCECRFHINRKCGFSSQTHRTPRPYYENRLPVAVDQIRRALLHKPDAEVLGEAQGRITPIEEE